ncbi:MAG: hypothetical protein P4M15_07345, partial [Alphaproteobacteria bacterium]|nr:hypothetical protein [Alphaproteobacteria bacterium]
MLLFGWFAGVALAFGLWLAWSRITLAPPPRWSEAQVRFLGHGQAKGDFGELLTAAILTQNGWRQLPSKIDDGGHGIDGLFLRRHWLLGFVVLLTETKVNASRYRRAQLAQDKLIRAVGDLYLVRALDWQTSAAIVRAMKWRSPNLRREFWHHSLHNGITTVTRANRQGRLLGRAKKRDTAALMESLAMMIGAL